MRKLAVVCYALLFLIGVACALVGGGQSTPPPEQGKEEVRARYTCDGCGDVSTAPGKCSLCGMDLVESKAQ